MEGVKHASETDTYHDLDMILEMMSSECWHIYRDNYAKVKMSFKYANWFYWKVNVLFGDELFGYMYWPKY